MNGVLDGCATTLQSLASMLSDLRVSIPELTAPEIVETYTHLCVARVRIDDALSALQAELRGRTR